MPQMSNYLKNKVLNKELQGSYVGLYSGGEEVSAASYNRVEVRFRDAEKGQTTNEIDVLFPIASETWGDITEIAIFDSEVGGEWLFKNSPEIIKNISEAGQYKIPAQYLVVRLK